MGKVYRYPDNDYRSYLEHGTKGKHWEWPKEKVQYIAKKITDSGAVRYIYDTAGKAKKAVSDFKTDIQYKRSGEYKDRKKKAAKRKDRYLERSGAKEYNSESTVLKEGKKVSNMISLLRPFEKYLRSRKVAGNIKKVDRQRKKEAKKKNREISRAQRKQRIAKLLMPLDNIFKYSKRKRSASAVAERMASVSAGYNAELERRRAEKARKEENAKKVQKKIAQEDTKRKVYSWMDRKYMGR